MHGRISYSFGDTEAKVDWGSFYPPLAGIRVNSRDSIQILFNDKHQQVLSELRTGAKSAIYDFHFRYWFFESAACLILNVCKLLQQSSIEKRPFAGLYLKNVNAIFCIRCYIDGRACMDRFCGWRHKFITYLPGTPRHSTSSSYPMTTNCSRGRGAIWDFLVIAESSQVLGC